MPLDMPPVDIGKPADITDYLARDRQRPAEVYQVKNTKCIGEIVNSILGVGTAYAGEQESIDYRRKGMRAWRKQKYDEAIEYFEKGIEEDPTRGDNYVMLGDCYLAKQMLDEGIELIKEGINLMNHSGAIALGHYKLARAYLEKGNYRSSMSHLDVYEKILKERGELTQKEIEDIHRFREVLQKSQSKL